MSLAQIRDEYRVPARMGQRAYVPALDQYGQIIGACGDYLDLELGTMLVGLRVHPENITYLPGSA